MLFDVYITAILVKREKKKKKKISERNLLIE